MRTATQTFISLTPLQRGLVIFLFAFGIGTRLYSLGEKAFHHDESIHCFYSWKIATDGRSPDGQTGTATFGYDPVYHGPFLYHFGALFFFLFGDSDFTARLPYASFGILLLWLVWEARKLVGVPMAIGMLAAVALSPLVNYYSRFARDDVYVGTAFFAVALYTGLYLKQRKSAFLILAAFFLVLGYCIKENSYIYGFTLGVFLVGYGLWRLAFRGKRELLLWIGPYYPLTILVTLYAFFSVFVFTFVAVDYWVEPNQGFVGGVVEIAKDAFRDEKLALSGPELRKQMEAQTRFFTDKSRTTAKTVYEILAFLLTLAALAKWELLRHFLNPKADGSRNKPEGARSEDLADLPVETTPARTGVKDFGMSLPLGLAAGLLFLCAVLLSVQSLVPFILAVFLWMAFETLRSDYLDPGQAKTWKSGLLSALSPWLLVTSCLVLVWMVYLFLFSQMFGDLHPNSRFAGRNGLERGLYDYIQYWFGHQLGEYRLWGPWWFYLARLLIYEFAFLAVSFVGLLGALGWCATRFVRNRQIGKIPAREIGPFHPFFVFILWMALFNTLIYAKLHEKVPWLAFHQALPWALVAGGLLGWALATFRYRWFHILLVAAVGPLALVTLKTHLQVNHLWPDNTAELVSQQQADRDIRDMVALVARLAAETGLYENFPLASEDEVEWPFPWYFRNYTKYRVKTADLNAFVQFGDDTTFREMRAKLGDKFTYRKYLHRGAWVENQMGSNELPGGKNLWDNVKAYINNQKFKGKPFRLLFWNYIFHRERWSDINTKWGYAYIRKDMLPTLEPIDVPKGTLDPPKPITAELRLPGPLDRPEVRFRVPRAITLSPSGHFHVVDSLNGRVVVLDQEGKFVREYGSPGSGPGQLKVDGTWGPSAVAVDGEENCFVADTWNHRVVVFDPQGTPTLSWGSGGEGTLRTTKFFGPRGIAIGPDGSIYVADTGEGEIEVFKPDGTLIRTIGKKGIKLGEFDEPVGLTFDTHGNLCVCDTGNERLQFLSPTGAPGDSWMVPGWEFDKIGMEPSIGCLADGRVLVTLSRKNLFRVYEKGGKSANNYSLGGNSEPIGSAFAPDGSLWLTDRTSNQVIKVRPLEHLR